MTEKNEQAQGSELSDQLGVAFDEKECMAYNPFEGDFGDGEVVLKDRIGRARKPGPCQICTGEIKPGERIRMRAEAYDGAIQTFRWCSACCHAMAISWEDSGEELERRESLRRE